jgi:acetyltransferase
LERGRREHAEMHMVAEIGPGRYRARANAGYPIEWERNARTRDGVEYRIRPIRTTDAQRERAFICGLSEESRYNRLMYTLREPSAALIEQLVDVDYHDTMAFLAVVGDGADERIIGIARYAADGSGSDCEFAVAIADAWQARGIGTTLMDSLFDYARAQGYRRIYGAVLNSNQSMIRLAHGLGLQAHESPDDAAQMIVSLDLTARAERTQV